MKFSIEVCSCVINSVGVRQSGWIGFTCIGYIITFRDSVGA